MKPRILQPKNIEEQIRHIGVLVERTNDDVKQIVERQDNLEDKFDNMQQTLDGHTEMIGKLAVGQEIHSEKLDKFGRVQESHSEKIDKLAAIQKTHTKKIDKLSVVQQSHSVKLDKFGRVQESHSEKIDQLAVNMEIVKSDIKVIKNTLDTKANTKDLAAIEGRVMLVERKV